MSKYRVVTLECRKRGSIGAFYPVQFAILADTDEQAIAWAIDDAGYTSLEPRNPIYIQQVSKETYDSFPKDNAGARYLDPNP